MTCYLGAAFRLSIEKFAFAHFAVLAFAGIALWKWSAPSPLVKFAVYNQCNLTLCSQRVMLDGSFTSKKKPG